MYLIIFCKIGRIPNEWARCLLPLVRDNKVKIEGKCEFAPNVLGIMDTIILSIRYMLIAKNFLACHTMFFTSYIVTVFC